MNDHQTGARRGRPRSPDRNDDSQDTVQALARGLGLLEVLAANAHGVLLTDLARQANLAASTTHRLLTTLERAGFAELEEPAGLWRVGVKTVSVGSAFIRGRDMVNQARSYMRDLTEKSGETSNLAIERDDAAVYLAQVESSAMVRAFSRLGDRVPLTCSGVGLALLSRKSEPELSALITRAGLPALTANSIHSRAALLKALDKVRRQGYVIDDEANVAGMRCVAAPLFDAWSDVVAAISISGPSGRLTPDRLDGLGRLVADTAAAITTRIGGRVP
ncbi:MAG: IclR family transcriptional regulator [Aquisalimonadaceae bacterium]